jgi:hypothetical protein
MAAKQRFAIALYAPRLVIARAAAVHAATPRHGLIVRSLTESILQ